MPILEYECPNGHRSEVFYKTFSEADEYETVVCESCLEEPYSTICTAKLVYSRPLGFGLYGNPAGYDKPSATKRFSNKTISMKDGNR